MITTTVRVSAWARVGDECEVSHRVINADDVEIQVGHYSESLDLSLTLRGLERLVETATAALADLRTKAA